MTKLLTILFIAWTAITWNFNCFQIPNQNDPCNVQLFNGNQEIKTESVLNNVENVWYWEVYAGGELVDWLISWQE